VESPYGRIPCVRHVICVVGCGDDFCVLGVGWGLWRVLFVVLYTRREMTALRVPPGATLQERAAIKAELDYTMASMDFLKFLKFVKILERPQRLMKIRGGKRDMELWDHTLEIARAMMVEDRLVVMKARQIGASWVAAAYTCWLFRFYPGSLIGMFSENQDKAIRLMEKVKFVYNNLPSAWQLPLAASSKLQMELAFGEGVTSTVTAFSSSADSGRGDDFSLIVMDEADFHEDLEEAYLTLAASVGSTGGQMFLISTVNKSKAESVFLSSFLGAPENGWATLFFGWRVRPGRDDAWYEREKRNVPKTSVLSVELFMSQEFPGSVEEALEPAGANAFFDLDVLEYMKSHIREPILSDGPVHIYTKHQIGRRYAAATDTSHGVGMDYSATYVVDLGARAVVARILTKEWGTSVFANESIKLLEIYGWPLWAIETNDWGIDVLRAAERAHYRNLYGVIKSVDKRRDFGWRTSESNRREMWLNLKEEIDRGAVIIPDEEGLAQMKQVVVIGSHGRMEARRGANDDVPTALAIAFMMDREVSLMSVDSRSRVVRSRF